MRVLQINAVYEILSTGRNVKEMHEYFLQKGDISYIACPVLKTDKSPRFYKIGNRFEHKIHALFSRLTGLQGYFSKGATRKLVRYIAEIRPDVILLHNMHGNYINFKILLEAIGRMEIPVVFILHDCWFYTGKCVYYSEDRCFRWKTSCGETCPALKKGNKSWFFDRSRKMFLEKKALYKKLKKYAVVGVSNWVTEDAKESILKDAYRFESIYNWIDLEKFSILSDDAEFKRSNGLENKFIILGVAAEWNEQKGILIIDELAEMMDEDSEIVLIGSLEEKYKRSNIRSIGRTDQIEELISWYSAADVFVNPSLQETFGKTTAESLACGTPVVGYGGTATGELLGDSGECGIIVNTLDRMDYFHAIEKIRKNGKRAYRQACRRRAGLLFDKTTNLEKYYRLIETMVDESCENR